MEEARRSDLQNRDFGEVVDDVMEQTHEVLERGAAVTAELEELKQRAGDALDWRKQLNRHRGLAGGLAIFIAALIVIVVVRD